MAIQLTGNREVALRGRLLGAVSPERFALAGVEGAELKPGDEIVIRTLQAGRVLGFSTVVREVVQEPAPLVFVEAPQQLEVHNLRKADRMDVFLPTDIRYKAGKPNAEDVLMLRGNLVDVSAGGCRIFTKRQIPLTTVVNVSFTLPGERHTLSLSGNVLESFAQSAVYGHRVKFFQQEKNVEDLAALKRWINQNAVFADLSG